MPERWIPVPGYVGAYEVSDRGRVRGLDYIVVDSLGRRRMHKGRVLKLSPAKRGYPVVKLGLNGKKSTIGLHQLVVLAFVGPCPAGMEVLHRNGDKLDNRLANLHYGTRSTNNLDSVAHGTHPWASKTHCPRDHEYSGDNVQYGRRGDGRVFRKCRACRRTPKKQAA